MKVLVAEDERVTRRSLERQLTRWGFEVVTAEDGEAAWEAFQRERFDIVVTDWEMPRCDGRELIERIRANGAERYVYVIMLTGRAEKEYVIAGLEAGADDFVTKPFDRDELRVRLNAGERIIQLERTLAARNDALASANDRMKRDLDAAAQVQKDLLPRELPETATTRFAWHFEPCDELGGDILNVLALDDRYVAMYALDVTGHGVPAALLSVTLSRVLTTRDPASSVLFDTSADDGAPTVAAPCTVLERLNRRFPMSDQGGKFIAMVYAVLDTETGSVCYALAGQPPPIIARSQQRPEQLEGTGFPIGIVDDPDFDEYSVQMQPGDRFYLYSDGITEAVAADGKMLGNEGFLELIEGSRDLPLDASIAKSMKDLEQWIYPTPFRDDVSLLALEMAS